MILIKLHYFLERVVYMSNLMKKIDKSNIIYIFLYCQPFIDLITSLMTRLLNLTITIGVVTRGLFLCILLFYTIFFTKTKFRKKTMYYFCTVFLFGIVYFFTKIDIFKISFLKVEFIYLFKYFYYPIVSLCIINCYHKLKLSREQINKIFTINAIVFSILILFPLITNIGFSSYAAGAYKGSIGWFYSANEIGAILTILFPYVYCLLNDGKFKRYIIVSLLLIFAMTAIGTKTAFLGMSLSEFVFFMYYVMNRKGENRVKKIVISLVIFVLSLVLIPSLPAISNLKNTIEINKINVEEVENVEHVKVPVSNSFDRKLNIIFSSRQFFLYDTISIYSKASLKDKLFGIGFVNRKSINDKKIQKLIEIDPLDIFFHYGIIGFILYFIPLVYIFFKSLYKVIKWKFRISFYQLLYLYSVALLIMISSIAGHILSAPAVSIYLAFSLILLYYDVNVVSKKKLKQNEITILALHLGYGGTEKYLSSLCKMLENDYKINIIVTYKVSEKPAFEFSDKIKIKYLIDEAPNRNNFLKAVKNKNVLNIFGEGIKAVKLLYNKRNKNISAIKKINSKYIITTRYFHNNLVGMYANDDIVKIATEHNFRKDDYKFAKKVVKSLKNFDYFVCVSKALKDFYIDKVKNTKCVFIPNVIDSLPSKYSNLNNTNLIHVGRFEEEKGQMDLLDVLSIVKKEIPNVKLFLIGDGSYNELLRKKVHDNGLDNNVIFTGFISKNEIEDYYLKSRLFVMTSYNESFGLVLIESMSYKVPAIAFDCASGANELLSNNVGVLVSDRNIKVMADNIICLLKDDDKIKEYSNTCYQYCKKYLLENVKKDWINLLIEK